MVIEATLPVTVRNPLVGGYSIDRSVDNPDLMSSTRLLDLNQIKIKIDIFKSV